MAEKRNLLELLSEVRRYVLDSEDPKTHAMFAMGSVMGIALAAGWTPDELVNMGLIAPPERET